MQIGKIVKSNSHTDYICQVYQPGEVESPPQREDYAFGTFVQVGMGNDEILVGIIYDTQLFNPDFGRLGPRLSPETELAVFSPDYLSERVTLVGIAAVGQVDSDGTVNQGVPSLSASSDAIVESMPDEQIRIFHEGNPNVQIEYAPLLIAQGSPLVIPLLRTVINELTTLFPDQETVLSLLEDDLAWKAQVNPMGGAR